MKAILPPQKRWLVISSTFSTVLATTLATTSPVWAENLALPAQRYDLSEWYLTLPTDDNNDGKADNISVEDLQSFTHPSFFYLNNEGGLVL